MYGIARIALAGLLTVGVGAPASARVRGCNALCRLPIRACRKAVPSNSSCPGGKDHRACVRGLNQRRAHCRTDALSQCHQTSPPTTCLTCAELADLGPCTGTLTGAPVAAGSEPFTCTSTFGNHDLTDQTHLRLNVNQPPADVATFDILLRFGGAPLVAPHQYALSDLVPTSTVGLFLSSLAEFRASPPATGDVTLALTKAVPRYNGTPGDYCLHGTLDATLPHVSGTGSGSLTLHADF